MAERRYDGTEIRDILCRAAELQMQEPPDLHLEGLSARDIQRAAGEVGIEARHVIKAVEEVEALAHRERFYPLGAAASTMLERVVDVQLSTDAWDDIVWDMRSTFGGEDEVLKTDTTLQWKGGSEASHATLSIANRGGKSRIQLNADYTFGIRLAWAVGVGVTILFSVLFGRKLMANGYTAYSVFAFVTTLLILMVVATHFAVRTWAWKAQDKLRLIMDKLEADAKHPAAPERKAPPQAERQVIKSRRERYLS